MKVRFLRSVTLAAVLIATSASLAARAEARALHMEVAGFSPRQTAASNVRRDQLLADLKTLSADEMEGRLVGTPGNAKARAFIIERFKAVGLKPFGAAFESPFTFTGGRGEAATERKGVNVIGYVAGTKQPARYIVVSAHYDHIGVRNGVIFNGADDNASGTAALFALAEYFVKNPPAHSIIFAAFDAEEGGLRGARAFVAQLTSPVVDEARPRVDDLIINLNMDMIGRDPNNLLYVVGTYTQPGLKPVIERVAAGAPVKLTMGHDDPTKKDVENWMGSSDHAAFCQAKVPCLYFGVEDFENHHKATDKYETMTHDFYVRVVETMIQVTKAFDAAPPGR